MELVDFSPTFYCLPKPLFLYGSMALLSYISTILLTMYYIVYVGLWLVAVHGDKYKCTPVAPVAQRYHVTSDTLGREFDPGKRDFSH